MDDTAANDIKRKLDTALAHAGPNAGILFDIDVFDAFVDRQWVTLAESDVWGFKVPAYGTHLAIRAWDVPPPGFKVGKKT
jgi:hypothetical protein